MKAGNIRIYKRERETTKGKRATYEYFIEIDPTIDPKTQKKKRQHLYKGGFRTKKEAHAAATLARNEYLASGNKDQVNMSIKFEALAELYLNRSRKALELTSVNMYENYVYKYFIPLLGERFISTIRPADIEEMLSDMMNDGEKSKVWILAAKTLIEQIFELAVREEYLSSNPVQRIKIKLKGKKSKERLPYTEEQIHALLDYCNINKYSFTTYRIVVVLAIYCGMRIGEILGLLWQDVDFEKKEIYIHQEMANIRINKKSMQIIKPPKSESSIRTICITDTVIDELLKAKEMQKRNKEELQEFWQQPQITIVMYKGRAIQRVISDTCLRPENTPVDFVCIQQNGKYIQSRNVDAFNEAATKRLGFHIFNHKSRHSHGTYLLDSGATVADIGNRLGHNPDSDATYTYLHSLENKEIKLAKDFENRLNINHADEKLADEKAAENEKKN